MKKIIGLLVLMVILASANGASALFLKTAQPAAQSTAPEAVKAVLSDFPMHTFKLKYANAAGLVQTISGLLAEGEGVSANEKTNSLVVRASEKSLKYLSDLVKQVDTAPLQVQVEAKIIELKSGVGDTNNPSSLGVSWKYYNPPKGATDRQSNFIQELTSVSTMLSSSLGLYAQLLSGNTEAYLSALEKTIGYDLVAAPWISALNHEESEILIGSKYGYTVTLTTQTGTLQDVQFLEVGTKLKFTPHINEDGYILMEIHPSISEGSVTNNLPQEDTTETKNKVLVKDGQSIVIGGLTKNYNREVETGVPILSGLPFLGILFRRTELQSEKREVMVIITPHIVTQEFLAEVEQKAKELDQRRQEWSEKAKLIR